ncbi:hypothetical protein P105_gp45 [Pelagibacter phage HTVC105P]|nr:hypothetical protein P105_gp45 [Pelagibacter phage HTVC105P]
MATLNLGRIKPVFRGAYAGGTAYVVDDIVTSGNETFICIQAGTGNATSNASYWTKLAAKGTDGTDVGTTITTQGDILYRDGSGLQRLAKPASDKFLQNTSGGVLSWETVTSAVLKVENFYSSTRTSLSGSSYQTAMSGNFTKTSASSKILMIGSYNMYGEVNGSGTTQFEFGTSSVDAGITYGRTAHQTQVTNQFYISNNTQTGSLAWTWKFKHFGGSIFNPDANESGNISTTQGSTVTIIEYA